MPLPRPLLLLLSLSLSTSIASACATPPKTTPTPPTPTTTTPTTPTTPKKTRVEPVVEPAPVAAEEEAEAPVVVEEQPVAKGACAVVDKRVKMFWKSCADNVNGCVEEDGAVFLQTPARGKVAREAHLITVEDAAPTSATDGLQRHLRRSQERTGHKLVRAKPWANWAQAQPSSKRFGKSSSGKLPVVDEAWYVTLYWREKPAPGTRVIVRNPANGRAVVAAAGWETGPASNRRVAGVSEEIHHWLGTSHDAVLDVGFAADASLPLGPIACE